MVDDRQWRCVSRNAVERMKTGLDDPTVPVRICMDRSDG